MRRIVRTLVWAGLGLLIGAGLGLYLGWVAWPAEFSDASPALLADAYREDYARMIAAAYAEDGDLAQARWRVATLDAADPNGWLLAVVVDAVLQQGEDEETLRRLVRLAADLGLRSPAMDPYLSPLGEPGS
jgi:hypothetical protein